MRFFKRYNRIIGLTYGVVLLISAGLVMIQAETKYEQQMAVMIERFHQTAFNIGHYLKNINDHLLLLDRQARAGMDPVSSLPQAESFFNQLQDVMEENYFYWDIPSSLPREKAAHLSGMGSHAGRPAEFYDEMAAMLRLVPLFAGAIDNLRHSSWVYYTSARGFIIVYPWMPPETYHFTESTFDPVYPWMSPDDHQLDRQAYEKACERFGPAVADPLQKIVWSQAYIDQAGLGLMVACSAPVYFQQQFRGCVSVDVSLAELNRFVTTFPYQNARVFLVSDRDELLAHPALIRPDDQEVKPAVMGFPERIRKDFAGIFKEKPLTRQLLEEWVVVYQNIENSPWKLVLTAPRSKIYLTGIMEAAPVFIALLLGLTLMLVIAHAITRREFIRPAHLLVNHIQNASYNPDAPVPGVQPAWRPWFESISRIFKENERLLSELTEKNIHLDALVASRTEELRARNTELEDTLVQLKEMQEKIIMQEKMASLGMLTAGVAHEMKNPLNFIKNFAELSAELIDELDMALHTGGDRSAPERIDEIRELMATLRQNIMKIRDHGNNADNIVRSMLRHSRGKPGERTTVDVNKLVEEYVKLAYHGIRARDPSFSISLITDYDPDAGSAAVVAQDLGRAVLNIVENACDAAFEKKKNQGPEFVAEVRVKTIAMQDRVELYIRDNGGGIRAEDRDNIFTPFFTTKPPGRGTGLGLSITYDIIVREHKGDIRVDSVEDQYTEFIISLPKVSGSA
jgi:signal transduction histidine kinase